MADVIATCAGAIVNDPTFDPAHFAACVGEWDFVAVDAVPSGYQVAVCEGDFVDLEFWAPYLGCSVPWASAEGGGDAAAVDLAAAGGMFSTGFSIIGIFFVLGRGIRAVLGMVR